MRPTRLLLAASLGLALAGCPGEEDAAPAAASPSPTGVPDPTSGTLTSEISEAELKAKMQHLEQAMKVFQLENDRFPEDMAELRAAGVEEDYLTDPWGHEFVIVTEGRRAAHVVTYGADAQPGGAGPDTDLSSKDLLGG